MYRKDRGVDALIDIICNKMDRNVEVPDLTFLNRRVGLGYNDTESLEFTNVKKKIINKAKKVHKQITNSDSIEIEVKRFKI
ncbi:hypothetical protein EHP00_1322 [Ecytonucleospora hepatopenaei]|uniref:Uncharacterized protein n=1 Tax=Ecytonucleospora hepatopenaei TaxID=646526 RepID=A0A1W0E5E4_9MICR|nr:hypothetical protein EHP00_1322 [Ecytonucleospora hepatopenaei]